MNKKLTGKKALICGAGGKSGRAAVRLLARLGARIGLSDGRSSEEGGPTLGELLPDRAADHEAALDFRPRQDPGLLDEFAPDLLLTAPGVPLANPIFQSARELGIPVYGENDFAFHLIEELWRHRPFVIGVTGTDGKSTTTALIAHLIEYAVGHQARACGNYGLPLSDLVLDAELDAPTTVLVVECSSFQLEAREFFHPQISMILNLAEDHLDRYRHIDDYLTAKWNITGRQNEEDLFLTVPQVAVQLKRLDLLERSRVRKEIVEEPELSEHWIPFRGRPLMPRIEFGLPGEHNRQNLRFALRALDDFLQRRELEVAESELIAAISSFASLPHRLQQVGGRGPYIFVNDSKATTAQAVITALQSFADEPNSVVYLLCGGRNKGVDFRVLPRENRALKIFPFGESGGEIAGALGVRDHFPGLEAAFAAALAAAGAKEGLNAVNGGEAATATATATAIATAIATAEEEKEGSTSSGRRIFLLSPGCTSFDAYSSYAERGEHFQDLVRRLLR